MTKLLITDEIVDKLKLNLHVEHMLLNKKEYFEPDEERRELIRKYREQNKEWIEPTLAVVRIGNREDDIAYENSIKNLFFGMILVVLSVVLDEDVTT